jgi:hypothetical protein
MSLKWEGRVKYLPQVWAKFKEKRGTALLKKVNWVDDHFHCRGRRTWVEGLPLFAVTHTSTA